MVRPRRTKRAAAEDCLLSKCTVALVYWLVGRHGTKGVHTAGGDPISQNRQRASAAFCTRGLACKPKLRGENGEGLLDSSPHTVVAKAVKLWEQSGCRSYD